MPYKIISGKGGKQVKNGDWLKVNVMTKINDSVYFTTYDKAPIYIPVMEQTQPYDISEVLPLVKQGDSVYAVQAMDTFMKRSPGGVPPNFKKGDKIITTIKVLNVFKSQEEYQKDALAQQGQQIKQEEAVLKSYLNKNNINAQRTPSGAYVQITEPGEGAQIAPGKYVKVMYRGKTFANKAFDSNMDPSFGHTDPLGFVVGSGGSIQGFDEGLQLLKKGARATIYIPSMLAYGPQPPSPEIKPYENLIFDVQVVDVQDKAPQQSMQVNPGIDTTRMPR